MSNWPHKKVLFSPVQMKLWYLTCRWIEEHRELEAVIGAASGGKRDPLEFQYRGKSEEDKDKRKKDKRRIKGQKESYRITKELADDRKSFDGTVRAINGGCFIHQDEWLKRFSTRW